MEIRGKNLVFGDTNVHRGKAPCTAPTWSHCSQDNSVQDANIKGSKCVSNSVVREAEHGYHHDHPSGIVKSVKAIATCRNVNLEPLKNAPAPLSNGCSGDHLLAELTMGVSGTKPTLAPLEKTSEKLKRPKKQKRAPKKSPVGTSTVSAVPRASCGSNGVTLVITSATGNYRVHRIFLMMSRAYSHWTLSRFLIHKLFTFNLRQNGENRT